MKSRRTQSTINATVTLLAQLIKVLGNFVVQTIFVKTLGASYLGANGLFTNLIVFLSFAELGVGSAFSFSLYEPIARNNHDEISAIMTLYRKVYNCIGTVIFFSGLLLMIFVPYLTKNNHGISYIRFYFLLYLLSTVVSYYFTYNRSLLIADQCGYIDSINQLIYSLIKYLLQFISLMMYSYTGYLVSQIFTNLLSNISITHLAKRKYPFLDEHSNVKIPKSTITSLRRNVIGTIASKVGAVVVNGTDNVLISKFVGLSVVGLYSNYSLVVTGITNILNQVLNSVVSSFGNLGVVERENKEKQLNLFYQFVFYNAFSVFFIALTSLMVFQPFIFVWLGKSYQLSIITVNLIVINFMFGTFRPALNLINAYGLFWGYRYKSIVEALTNFIISLYLVSKTNMGINGVLLGTIISNIFVNSWWDPLILFAGAYKIGISRFYFKYWLYVISFFVILGVCNYVQVTIKFIPKSFFDLVWYIIIVSVFVLITLLVLFSFTHGERDMFRRIMRR